MKHCEDYDWLAMKDRGDGFRADELEVLREGSVKHVDVWRGWFVGAIVNIESQRHGTYMCGLRKRDHDRWYFFCLHAKETWAAEAPANELKLIFGEPYLVTVGDDP